jgi:hypothetical protein
MPRKLDSRPLVGGRAKVATGPVESNPMYNRSMIENPLSLALLRGKVAAAAVVTLLQAVAILLQAVVSCCATEKVSLSLCLPDLGSGCMPDTLYRPASPVLQKEPSANLRCDALASCCDAVLSFCEAVETFWKLFPYCSLKSGLLLTRTGENKAAMSRRVGRSSDSESVHKELSKAGLGFSMSFVLSLFFPHPAPPPIPPPHPTQPQLHHSCGTEWEKLKLGGHSGCFRNTKYWCPAIAQTKVTKWV